MFSDFSSYIINPEDISCPIIVTLFYFLSKQQNIKAKIYQVAPLAELGKIFINLVPWDLGEAFYKDHLGKRPLVYGI